MIHAEIPLHTEHVEANNHRVASAIIIGSTTREVKRNLDNDSWQLLIGIRAVPKNEFANKGRQSHRENLSSN